MRQLFRAQGTIKQLLVKFRTSVSVFRWPVLRLEKPVLFSINRLGTASTRRQLI